MILLHYRYSDKEIKEILKTMVVLIDTREQMYEHIASYLETKGIKSKRRKLDVGDYSVMLPANHEMGIARDIYFPVAIERKNSVDELAQTIKQRERFENELIRSYDMEFTLMVEDPNGYENIIQGNYRSQYAPKALLGSLKSFESRYHFSTVFVSKFAVGNFIYHHFYYFIRNQLLS